MPEEQQVSREGSGGGGNAVSLAVERAYRGHRKEPSCRVYVGNLSWRVRWQDLKDHMKQAGEVVRADVFEDFQGKSKGCGIVQYENAEGAQKAIKELTDSELFDRLIFVREDREDEHRLPGGRRGGYDSNYFFRGSRYYGGSWRGRRGTAYRFGYRGERGASSSSATVKGEEDRQTHGTGGAAGGSGAAAVGATSSSSRSTSSGPVGSSSSSSSAYDRYGRGGVYGGAGGNVYGFGGGRRPSGRGGFRGGTRGGSFGGYGGYRGGRGGYAGGGGPPPAGSECAGRQIFVSNLPWRTSWQDLKDLFRECGDVVRADVMTMPDGRSKGVGTVLFASPEGADRAVQMFNEYMLDGRPILVRIDRVA